MKLRIAVSLVFALAAVGAAAQGRDTDGPAYAEPAENVNYSYADVLRVDPIFDRVQTAEPQEECYDERVVTHERGGNTSGGTVLGAIIGGALGSTVGKGDGRKAATIAGAVIGGAVGHDAAKHNGSTYETTERRCRQVGEYREEERVVGYDVEYRYRGEVYMSRLNFDPGDRLRIRVSVTPAQ